MVLLLACQLLPRLQRQALEERTIGTSLEQSAWSFITDPSLPGSPMEVPEDLL